MANYGENNEKTHISTLLADRPLFENTNFVDREKKRKETNVLCGKQIKGKKTISWVLNVYL